MNRKAMDKGIIVAGSMIVDNLKKIDIYPGPCNLTPIRKNEMALGGLVNNCIQDLARIDPEIPLKALGIVGDDTCGNFIFEKLGKFSNIDVSALQKRPSPTLCTTVSAEQGHISSSTAQMPISALTILTSTRSPEASCTSDIFSFSTTSTSPTRFTAQRWERSFTRLRATA